MSKVLLIAIENDCAARSYRFWGPFTCTPAIIRQKVYFTLREKQGKRSIFRGGVFPRARTLANREQNMWWTVQRIVHLTFTSLTNDLSFYFACYLPPFRHEQSHCSLAQPVDHVSLKKETAGCWSFSSLRINITLLKRRKENKKEMSSARLWTLTSFSKGRISWPGTRNVPTPRRRYRLWTEQHCRMNSAAAMAYPPQLETPATTRLSAAISEAIPSPFSINFTTLS